MPYTHGVQRFLVIILAGLLGIAPLQSAMAAFCDCNQHRGHPDETATGFCEGAACCGEASEAAPEKHDDEPVHPTCPDEDCPRPCCSTARVSVVATTLPATPDFDCVSPAATPPATNTPESPRLDRLPKPPRQMRSV